MSTSAEKKTEETVAVNPNYQFRYRPPWTSYAPTVFLVFILNYMAFTSVPSPEDKRVRLTPKYLSQYYDHLQTTKTGDDVSDNFLVRYPFLFPICQFWEAVIIDNFYRLGIFIFRDLSHVYTLTLVVWLIHFFELGICMRVCFSCHVSPLKTFLYALCTATGGVGQLVPLLNERDYYLTQHPEIAEKKAKDNKERAGKKKDPYSELFRSDEEMDQLKKKKKA